jgi:hypothetical protein
VVARALRRHAEDQPNAAGRDRLFSMRDDDAGLVAWHYKKDRKRREQTDDLFIFIFEKFCGVRDPSACDAGDEKRRFMGTLIGDGTVPER